MEKITNFITACKVRNALYKDLRKAFKTWNVKVQIEPIRTARYLQIKVFRNDGWNHLSGGVWEKLNATISPLKTRYPDNVWAIFSAFPYVSDEAYNVVRWTPCIVVYVDFDNAKQEQ